MKDIKILKPGQTGFGIMIEQDAGYISPNDNINKSFINEMQKIAEGKGIIPNPLILYVVLQKYGVENKNGRVYPEHILRRENDKYQELIRENRAIGECVPENTGIFTKDGWKNIQDVKIGDEIFTLNIQTNKLEIQPVTHTIKKPYNDEMIRIYNSSSLDMLVTKKHKLVLWDRSDKPYTLTAEEVYDKINQKDSVVSHSYIKKSGDWVGTKPEYITIPNTDYKIKPELWAKFLGIYLAEGHSDGVNSGNIINRVTITQFKEDSRNKIKNMLDEMPFEYKISKDESHFTMYNKELHRFLFPLGNSENKYIPQYAKDWDNSLLNILIEWMLMGDGVNRKNVRGDLMREYYTTSPKLAEDFMEILLKTGNGASIRIRTQKDRYIKDYKLVSEETNNNGNITTTTKKIETKRLIKAENSKPLFIISESITNGKCLDVRFTKADKISFNDNVYCVTVENGTWLMKYNDKISWTHNCEHPESSIVNTERISHNITETWWEGKTLLGKMEIIMSPGYINNGVISCLGDHVANLLRKGIMIGVSSRGVGSLKEVNGKNIVQDDFELICWDIVTSPSTPGSWIFNKKEEMQPFTESKITQKTLLIDKLDKFLL